jgi:hypothetical protein
VARVQTSILRPTILIEFHLWIFLGFSMEMLLFYLKICHDSFLSNIIWFIIHTIALWLIQIINDLRMNEMTFNWPDLGEGFLWYNARTLHTGVQKMWITLEGMGTNTIFKTSGKNSVARRFIIITEYHIF